MPDTPAPTSARVIADSPYVVTVERTIDAPAETIFAMIASPARHKDFDGSGTVRDATDVPAGKLKIGDRFGMNMKMGVSYSMLNTVVEYDENRRIAWQTTSPTPILRHLVGGRIWRYELEPLADGSSTENTTRVRESWDLTHERGKQISFRLMKSKTVKAMIETLNRVAQLVR